MASAAVPCPSCHATLPPGQAACPRCGATVQGDAPTVPPPTAAAAAPPSPASGEWDFLAPAAGPGELGRLGAYRVLGVLGKGGMGVVFRAEDTRLRRAAALKVMLPAVAAVPEAKQRFLREARATAAVEHDHVIPIFQVDEDRGVPFIAMPLLKGQTLADALARQPRLPVAEVLRIGREMAEGLAAAHAAGLIHRDVKPGNVWLEGERRRVKILDFGLVRTADAPDAPSPQPRGPLDSSGTEPLTLAGAALGTPAYMSPEQADSRPVDARTDLFSLGVVLYQMATGRGPFARTSALASMSAVMLEEPPPPRDLAPDLPAALNALILRLLAKAPDGRPPSAQAVAEELRRIGEVPGPPAEPPRPPARFPGRLVVTGVAAVVILVAGGALALRGWPAAAPRGDRAGEAPPGAPPAPPEPQRTAPALEPRPPLDPHRAAAERLIPASELVLAVDGKTQRVRMNQPLPAGPFQVRGVTLVNSQGPPDRYIPEVVLPALGGLTGLESIGTDRPAWTEADLARLTETPNVRSVTKLLLLVELTPTAVGLAQRFPRLHDVAFTASAADDALLAQLPKAFPRLVGLKLKRLGESGRVTVRGYAALAAMPLGYLELNQAQGFDREAAARLATMPHLTSLFLTGTPVSPEVTAELARCPTLWELRLAETGLTDAGLSPLAALKSLKRLDLSHTRVTEAGRRKLAQALPQVKIVTDGKPGAPEPPADPDPSPFDRLRREAIPPAKLQAAGNPPPEVVAILGESQGQKSPAHLHLAVHPQGTVVALGGDIYRQPPVVLWDPITGEERPFGGPKGVVTGLHLDPTGTWLATASAGAGLWNLATGAPGRRLSDRPYRTWASVAFTPDGRWVAYANRGIVVRQDQDPPALFRVDDPNAPPVPPEGAADAQMDALAMSPDGQFLAGSGHPADLQGNWVKLWAVPDGKLVRVLNPDLADRTLAFSPDGRRLFTTRYRLPEVFVYDVATGQGLAPFRGHTRLHDRPALVSDAAVSPDGRRVASCDWNGAVVVWDPETLQQEQVIRLNPPTSGDVTGSVGGGVHKVYWAPDGRHLVTKNADGTAYVVRLNPGPP